MDKNIIYVFWTNILSMHMAPFIRALAEIDGVAVIFAYEEDLPSAKRHGGWYVPDFGKATVVDARLPGQLEDLCRFDTENCYHCFGGIFHLKFARRALKSLLNTRSKKILISEPFDFRGLGGFFRFVRLALLIRTVLRKHFAFVFAMGDLGVSCFQNAGMYHWKLVKFSYLTDHSISNNDNSSVSEAPARGRTCTFQFIFVGQLIKRKGWDVLLHALALIRNENWSLDIVGDGPDNRRIHQLAYKLGIMSRILFRGSQPNSTVIELIRQSDCLVLPSRFDGWGAVVNEALLVGTPAIVSDKCGASTLLKAQHMGYIFQSGNAGSLANALRDAIADGSTSQEWRSRRSRTAAVTLEPRKLASYFHAVATLSTAPRQFDTE